ncbi:unnamed protein product (macronuclear) [Paramecium tetraurelia]|uniref:Uncharacterized protein n=1 Tax=Paramecium tetraurelia TaxID=5888 RepID=A0EGQ9_PARTE|nr:uncharacterized protein GSPATT00026824001 [Paramecium tetraurelia]CAK94500.1 unnamed protein product [Paramecium tetraurelia]|eukprot:XP_001461873.1 hypothetical protein (macronuclear) [Paramecium tetraurelia strain d4-2]
MNIQETYHLYLEDYFVGEGLSYSLNDNNEFFQINRPQNQGGIQGEPISLMPKPKYVPQQKEFLLLLKINEGDQDTYEIHSLNKFSKIRRFSASELIVKFNSDRCNQMNSFDNFIIITCLDYEEEQLNYLIFDSDYQLIKTFKFDIKYAQYESILISKSAGKYLCTLINNGQQKDNEYISNYSNLIIFQLETQNLADSKTTINIVQLNQIQTSADFISDFDLVKEGYLFISYFNLGVQIHQLNEQKLYQLDISIKKRILGIRAQKISYGFHEYNIVYWNEEHISNFLYEPIKNKIISWEKKIQTNQINLSLNFVTSVFINDKFIVVSNTNGISIYPTIINDVNEGMQLYYYPSKSALSYFINIIDYLISIEEGSLILYMINDPLIKITASELQKIPQSFKIRAISNQFDKPQVECPILNLYFQVQIDYNPTKIQYIYFDQPFQVWFTQIQRGVYQDVGSPYQQIKIKIDQDKIQEVKWNQLIIKNGLQLQGYVSNSNQVKVEFDKVLTEHKTFQNQYDLGDVAYMKQQLLYQYQTEFKFREKFYMITQSYFKLDLQECGVNDPQNCELILSQNLEIRNTIHMIRFNIHNDYAYLAIDQQLIYEAFENLQLQNIKNSKITIFRFKMNEKNKSVKVYKISHLLHQTIQIDIIDDRLYMLYKSQVQNYIFTSKITEINPTLDILQLSHKVNKCQNFAFNIELYGYFLYYFTVEIIEQDDVTRNFELLNVINIEDGKFELVNAIKYKEGLPLIKFKYSYVLYLTKGGVYLSQFTDIVVTYLTKSNFLTFAFTQYKDKDYERFRKKNLIVFPGQEVHQETNPRIKRSSSEIFFYLEPVYITADSNIVIYNMRSTILNCQHFSLADTFLDIERNYVTTLKKDIFAIHKSPGKTWVMNSLLIQFITHEPKIKINYQANTKENPLKIEFTVLSNQLGPEESPQFQLIIESEQQNQENSQQEASQQQNNQQQQNQQQINELNLEEYFRRLFDQLQQTNGIQFGTI